MYRYIVIPIVSYGPYRDTYCIGWQPYRPSGIVQALLSSAYFKEISFH